MKFSYSFLHLRLIWALGMVSGLGLHPARGQVVAAFPNENGTYHNPVIASDGPDPSYIKADDGYFYLYSTGEKIWRSKNLTSWTYVGRVFSDYDRPNFVEGVSRFWAPCINKIGDKYVIYFAMSKWGGTDSCGIGVATSSTPSGPFIPYDKAGNSSSEHGKMFLSCEIGVKNSIDPCFFEEEGKKYLIWGSYTGGIYAIRLTDDGLEVMPGAEKVQIAATTYEGSYIYKRGEYYYFFGSINNCCDGANSIYTTVYARSKNLLGPYVNKTGGSLLAGRHEVLIHNNDNWAGTGHNGEILTDKNGDTWLLYHAYNKKNDSLGRLVLLDQIQWTVGGWPYVVASSPSAQAAAPVF